MGSAALAGTMAFEVKSAGYQFRSMTDGGHVGFIVLNDRADLEYQCATDTPSHSVTFSLYPVPEPARLDAPYPIVATDRNVFVKASGITLDITSSPSLGTTQYNALGDGGSIQFSQADEHAWAGTFSAEFQKLTDGSTPTLSGTFRAVPCPTF